MKELSAKKFLIIFSFIVAVLIAITISINVYVNPYSYYGNESLGTLKVFNAQKAKYLHLEQLKKKPNAYVLGSSNSMRMLPKTIDSLFNVKSFNYGVYQASVEDFYCITNALVKDLKVKPKLVIICIDDWNFAIKKHAKDKVFDGAQNRLVYATMMSKYLADFSEIKLLWARFKTALGYNQLEVSLDNLKSSIKRGKKFKRTKIRMTSPFYPDGVRRSYANEENEIITDLAESGKYDIETYLKKQNDSLVKNRSITIFRNSHEDIEGIDPERLYLLDSIITLLEQNNCKVILNVMPMQPFYQRMVEQKSNYNERLVYLLEYLNEMKQKHKNVLLVKDNHDIKNFNGLPNHFFDHIHPTSVNSDSMLFSIKRKIDYAF